MIQQRNHQTPHSSVSSPNLRTTALRKPDTRPAGPRNLNCINRSVQNQKRERNMEVEASSQKDRVEEAYRRPAVMQALLGLRRDNEQCPRGVGWATSAIAPDDPVSVWAIVMPSPTTWRNLITGIWNFHIYLVAHVDIHVSSHPINKFVENGVQLLIFMLTFRSMAMSKLSAICKALNTFLTWAASSEMFFLCQTQMSLCIRAITDSMLEKIVWCKFLLHLKFSRFYLFFSTIDLTGFELTSTNLLRQVCAWLCWDDPERDQSSSDFEDIYICLMVS